jgi:hypothetical protein
VTVLSLVRAAAALQHNHSASRALNVCVWLLLRAGADALHCRHNQLLQPFHTRRHMHQPRRVVFVRLHHLLNQELRGAIQRLLWAPQGACQSNSPKPQPTALFHSIHAAQLPTQHSTRHVGHAHTTLGTSARVTAPAYSFSPYPSAQRWKRALLRPRLKCILRFERIVLGRPQLARRRVVDAIYQTGLLLHILATPPRHHRLRRVHERGRHPPRESAWRREAWRWTADQSAN